MSQPPATRDDRHMTRSVLVPLLIPALALAAASIALSGCSAISDTLHQESHAEFDSAAAMSAGWNGSAPWVPFDAAKIRIREHNGGSPAILRVTSSATLDRSCVQHERLSGPAFSEDWVPNAYVDQIWVCGDWAVIPTADGYFGWTPIAPGEMPGEDAASTP
jgi:hypothetical protein